MIGITLLYALSNLLFSSQKISLLTLFITQDHFHEYCQNAPIAGQWAMSTQKWVLWGQIQSMGDRTFCPTVYSSKENLI